MQFFHMHVSVKIQEVVQSFADKTMSIHLSLIASADIVSIVLPDFSPLHFTKHSLSWNHQLQTAVESSYTRCTVLHRVIVILWYRLRESGLPISRGFVFYFKKTIYHHDKT